MAVDGLAIAKNGKQGWQAQLSALAAMSGELAALEAYVAGCRNLNAKDEDGLALIHYAACYGNIPLLRLLSEHGADMNLPDAGSPAWRPIHYAVFHRQTEAEKILRTFCVEAPLPILQRIAAERPCSMSNRQGAVIAGCEPNSPPKPLNAHLLISLRR